MLRRHPWVFSGAIDRRIGEVESGGTVKVLSASGEFLAWASYSPASQISARVWSWSEDEEIGADFFRKRLNQALVVRRNLFPDIFDGKNPSGALRLVYGESDGIPGLILDRYADTLVMQILTCGAEYWKETLADLCMELTDASRIYERSDVDVRKLEGLPFRAGCLRGDEPPERILILENGIQFWVDVRQGHKTGFYLDQRWNRERVAGFARGRDVLDCFCYTGGFSTYAAAQGAASVLAVDSSAEALAMARDHIQLNHLDAGLVSFQEGDVFMVLREMRDRGRKFDLVILDPPKFAQSASQVERASRGYKDINLLALKLLRPGGYLATFSCSGGIGSDLFQKIIAGAALDAKVDAQIVAYLQQGPDHPVALNFPEGMYLKGLIVRVG